MSLLSDSQYDMPSGDGKQDARCRSRVIKRYRDFSPVDCIVTGLPTILQEWFDARLNADGVGGGADLPAFRLCTSEFALANCARNSFLSMIVFGLDLRP